jgi:hypothetical protein
MNWSSNSMYDASEMASIPRDELKFTPEQEHTAMQVWIVAMTLAPYLLLVKLPSGIGAMVVVPILSVGLSLIPRMSTALVVRLALVGAAVFLASMTFMALAVGLRAS